MGPIGCPKTLGRNYHYLLHNNVERVSQTNMSWQAENLAGYITENSYMILAGQDAITQLSGTLTIYTHYTLEFKQ
jgi:putative aminopeptidase FrvX